MVFIFYYLKDTSCLNVMMDCWFSLLCWATPDIKWITAGVEYGYYLYITTTSTQHDWWSKSIKKARNSTNDWKLKITNKWKAFQVTTPWNGFEESKIWSYIFEHFIFYVQHNSISLLSLWNRPDTSYLYIPFFTHTVALSLLSCVSCTLNFNIFTTRQKWAKLKTLKE